MERHEPWWPRACSFWVSMHLMALRADLQPDPSVRLELYGHLQNLIAGGALQCGGCTRHFRYLNRGPKGLEGLNPKLYCVNYQCPLANDHVLCQVCCAVVP